ncbi:MAG: hypothetical protein ACI4E1_01220 [Lachnospira sp.]
MDLRKIIVPKTIIILMCALLVNMVLFIYGLENDKQDKDDYLKKQQQYATDYNAYVNNVISNAKGMSEVSIFSKEGSVSAENIDSIANAYERIKDIEMTNEDNRGVRYYLDYSYGIIIVTLLMVYLIYLMFEDRTNGMWQLTYSSSGGRSWLTLSRMITLAVLSFASIVFLEFPRLIYASIKYGEIKCLYTFIQNIEGYGNFTYPLSKMQYILLLTFIQWLIVVCISFLVFTLFSVFRNRNFSLIIISGIGIAEYLLYINTSSTTIISILRHINICKLFDVNIILKRFYNVNINNLVFTDINLIMWILIVFIIVEIIVSIFSNIFMKPYGNDSFVQKKMQEINKAYQRVFSSYPIILKEFHKAVVSNRGLVIIVATIMAAMYFNTNGVVKYSDTVIAKEKIYEQYGGADYREISRIIDEMNVKCEAAKASLKEMEISYRAGNSSYEEYATCLGTFIYYTGQMSAYNEFEEKLDYLSQIKEQKGIDGWMVSERGYGNLFGENATTREYLLVLIITLATTLITFEYLTIDQKSGTLKIIRSSKNGKTRYSVMQIIICILLAILIYIIVYGIDYYYVCNTYIIKFGDAPVQSLRFMEKMNLRISIKEWVAIRNIIRLSESAISILLSFGAYRVASKNNNKVVVIVLCIIEIVVVTFIEKGIWELWN